MLDYRWRVLNLLRNKKEEAQADVNSSLICNMYKSSANLLVSPQNKPIQVHRLPMGYNLWQFKLLFYTSVAWI